MVDKTQYTYALLWNYTLKTFIILITNVTPIHLFKMFENDLFRLSVF